MTDTTKQKAVIYMRTASVPPDAAHHIFNQQEEACCQCAERNDLEIVRCFHDKGFSGNASERPALQEMMAFLEENTGYTLIVADISRLARNVDDALHLKLTLQSNGAAIIAADTNRVLLPLEAA